MKHAASFLRAAVLVALGGAVGTASADITVISFGGASQKAQDKAYYAPFSKATGVKVVAGEYNGEQAKIKAMGEVAAQFDRNGQVDYSKLLQKAFDMIDPILAEDVLVPQEMAAQKEVTETQGDISRMWAGVDLDAPQTGINPELRLQVIKNWMTGVPDNPAVDVQARVMADESLRKRIERYSQQLQFQLDQRENAQIGRIGTTPAGSVGA